LYFNPYALEDSGTKGVSQFENDGDGRKINIEVEHLDSARAERPDSTLAPNAVTNLEKISGSKISRMIKNITSSSGKKDDATTTASI
jgi:hypothetical protein